MSKFFMFAAAVAVAMTFSSCASKEKSYETSAGTSSSVSYAK